MAGHATALLHPLEQSTTILEVPTSRFDPSWGHPEAKVTAKGGGELRLAPIQLKHPGHGRGDGHGLAPDRRLNALGSGPGAKVGNAGLKGGFVRSASAKGCAEEEKD